MPSSSKLDAALNLARKGFEIFPFRYLRETKRDGTTKYVKIPLFEDWQQKATTDEEQIKKWWAPVFAGEPEADHNIGIITDRLLLVDFDVKANAAAGAEDMKRLIAEGLPLDAVAVTPSQGRHVYLRLPGGTRYANSVAKSANSLGDGTDTRSFGGFAGAPGSDGYGDLPGYAWVEGHEPENFESIPLAPDWLLKRCRPYTGKKRKTGETLPDEQLDTPAAFARVREYLEKWAREATSGVNGHCNTFAVANWCMDHVSEAATLDLMLDHWNETKAYPPWTAEELAEEVEKARIGRDEDIGLKSAAMEFSIVEPLPKEGSAEEKAEFDLSKPSGSIEFETFDEAIAAAGAGDEEFLVRGLLDLEALSVIYGAPNAGKSFASLELAHCIATGRDFAGLPVCQGGAVYIALEGVRGVRKRLKALRLAHPAADASRLFVARGDVDLFSNPKSQRELTAKILAAPKQDGVPVRIVILDTLARAMGGGDENATVDMGVFVKRASALGKSTNTHVCVIHHSGKDATKGARGSVALRAAVDTELEVKEAAAGKREIAVRKQRDHEYLRPIPFGLRPIKIGATKNLEDVMSCVVDFSSAAVVSEEELSDRGKMSLAALDAATDGGAALASLSAWDRELDRLGSEAGEKLNRNIRYKLRSRLEEAGYARREAKGFWRRLSPKTSPKHADFETPHGDAFGDAFARPSPRRQPVATGRRLKKAA